MTRDSHEPDSPALRLRAAPRPVTRLKRPLVVSVSVIAGLSLVFLIGRGFHNRAAGRRKPDSAQSVRPSSRPAVLEDLPSSYDRIRQTITHLVPSPPPVHRPRTLSRPWSPAGQDALRPVPSDAQARKAAEDAERARDAGVFFTRVEGVGRPKKARARVTAGSETGVDATGLRGTSFYALLPGTIITASLITGLNSDLPGPVLAQLTRNVYDSVTGTHLLLPQGARLIGSYDNHIAFGQNRVRVVFSRIVLPNGAMLRLDKLPASDQRGYVGLSGGVDDHLLTLLKGATLSSFIGIAAQQGLGLGDSLLAQALRQSVQSSANQSGQELVHKSINVAPTITVAPGTPLVVVVQKTLLLVPYHR
ncbi:MAG: TrbI/VirB10 family protein [Alphaproteobacteria bacterium]|nr:TrbI/VirB10 family protein [Alphaproteobacteria bacterium]